MKIHPVLFAAALLITAGQRLDAQTLNWGSEVFSGLADSKGNVLDNTFVFEIGAFTDGFVPDSNNVDSWLSNWKVFDQAAYSESTGYFTSSVQMLDNGTSDSPAATPSAPSFEGLSAYLWVRSGNDAVEGSEWLLVRSDAWKFPTATPGCCDKALPVQWSVSDLTASDVPVWGSQNGVNGGGTATAAGVYTLQTYTFVPEPSAIALASLAGMFLLRRRRHF